MSKALRSKFLAQKQIDLAAIADLSAQQAVAVKPQGIVLESPFDPVELITPYTGGKPKNWCGTPVPGKPGKGGDEGIDVLYASDDVQEWTGEPGTPVGADTMPEDVCYYPGFAEPLEPVEVVFVPEDICYYPGFAPEPEILGTFEVIDFQLADLTADFGGKPANWCGTPVPEAEGEYICAYPGFVEPVVAVPIDFGHEVMPILQLGDVLQAHDVVAVALNGYVNNEIATPVAPGFAGFDLSSIDFAVLPEIIG